MTRELDCTRGDSGSAIYAVGAQLYREAGWSGSVPLRQGEKVPLLAGFTWYDGGWPTDAKITEWMSKWPNNNPGLRVSTGFSSLTWTPTTTRWPRNEY